MASEKITAIVEELKTLTVLELSELVKAVEDEFGVEVPEEAVENLKTVGDVVKFIEENI